MARLIRSRKHRMYAVSLDGVGIIAGTMAYSRRAAIQMFQGDGFIPQEWERSKHAGYRTIQATVEWIDRFGGRHRNAP